MNYPVATIGTAIALGAGFLLDRIAVTLIRRRTADDRERYMRRTNARQSEYSASAPTPWT